MTCEATTKQPTHTCCVVDWPHTIHLGRYSRVRVRWTDDGTAPGAEELVRFEAECAERLKSRVVGPVR